jgi:hypothetical protein
MSVTETTDPTLANVVVDTGSTSLAGGFADGVLGCETSTGEITLIQGWNWYDGRDPSAIGPGQYDFQTAVTHELGHALGLGHSPDPTSVMYAALSSGTANRTPKTADLAIPDPGEVACPLHAAFPFPPAGNLAPVPGPNGPVGPAGAHPGCWLPNGHQPGLDPIIFRNLSSWLPNTAPQQAQADMGSRAVGRMVGQSSARFIPALGEPHEAGVDLHDSQRQHQHNGKSRLLSFRGHRRASSLPSQDQLFAEWKDEASSLSQKHRHEW